MLPTLDRPHSHASVGVFRQPPALGCAISSCTLHSRVCHALYSVCACASASRLTWRSDPSAGRWSVPPSQRTRLTSMCAVACRTGSISHTGVKPAAGSVSRHEGPHGHDPWAHGEGRGVRLCDPALRAVLLALLPALSLGCSGACIQFQQPRTVQGSPEKADKPPPPSPPPEKANGPPGSLSRSASSNGLPERPISPQPHVNGHRR